MNNSQNQKIPAKVIAAIIATGLLSFCGVIVETAMNIAFPKLMQQFQVTTNVVQWITSIYLLVVAIVVPLSALLKAKFKTKNLFITAASLFIIGIICDGLAPNFELILLGRAIQGIGTGISLPLMFNIIIEQVPSSKLGMMMGTVMTSALASLANDEHTQGNGILNTLQQFAGSMGTSLAAMAVAMSQSGQVSAGATAIGSQHAFMMLACFIVVIILVGIKAVPKNLN